MAAPGSEPDVVTRVGKRRYCRNVGSRRGLLDVPALATSAWPPSRSCAELGIRQVFAPSGVGEVKTWRRMLSGCMPHATEVVRCGPAIRLDLPSLIREAMRPSLFLTLSLLVACAVAGESNLRSSANAAAAVDQPMFTTQPYAGDRSLSFDAAYERSVDASLKRRTEAETVAAAVVVATKSASPARSVTPSKTGGAPSRSHTAAVSQTATSVPASSPTPTPSPQQPGGWQ